MNAVVWFGLGFGSAVGLLGVFWLMWPIMRYMAIASYYNLPPEQEVNES